jgi:hypothetical protein
MVGQASSLSIRDDGQDAHPTGNLSFGGPAGRGTSLGSIARARARGNLIASEIRLLRRSTPRNDMFSPS